MKSFLKKALLLSIMCSSLVIFADQESQVVSSYTEGNNNVVQYTIDEMVVKIKHQGDIGQNYTIQVDDQDFPITFEKELPVAAVKYIVLQCLKIYYRQGNKNVEYLIYIIQKALSHLDLRRGQEKNVSQEALTRRIKQLRADMNRNMNRALYGTLGNPETITTIEYLFPGTKTKIVLTRGDILQQRVDAVVNPVNKWLSHGGGLARKISDAAGSELQSHCNEINKQNNIRVPVGSAIIMPGFKLDRQNSIIHAVGPDMRINDEKLQAEQLLSSTYEKVLSIAAQDNGIKAIALPSISTGIFGYNIAQAAPIAIDTVINYIKSANQNGIDRIHFVLFTDDDFNIYKNILDGKLPPRKYRSRFEYDHNPYERGWFGRLWNVITNKWVMGAVGTCIAGTVLCALSGQ